MTQTEPIEHAQAMRIRTSYERVVPHLMKMPFVYMAEDDGKVLENDREIGLIKIEYNNGKKIAIEYGNLMSRYSAAGMFIRQVVVVHSAVEKNKTFKKDEPIVFNINFFQEDPFSNQLIMKIGYRAKVAILDTDGTIDDSNMLSSSLSQKLAFHPIHDRQLVLNKDFAIHSFADIGTKVNAVTPLMIFEEYTDSFLEEESMYDEETLNMIKKLNRKTPKSQYTGIVKDIKVQYTSPVSTMSDSMQKFIRYVDKLHNKKANFTKDTIAPIPMNGPIEYTDKLGMVDLDENTVIVTFYIQDEYSAKQGDKVTFAYSLKSVTSAVFEDPVYTEDGKYEIEGQFSESSIMNRITTSPIKIGAGSLVMEKANNDIINMYFNTR